MLFLCIIGSTNKAASSIFIVVGNLYSPATGLAKTNIVVQPKIYGNFRVCRYHRRHHHQRYTIYKTTTAYIKLVSASFRTHLLHY